MHFASQSTSLSKRLWLGFGSVLLLGAAAGALLWNDQPPQAPDAVGWQHWLAAGLALAAVLSAIVSASSIHRSVHGPLTEAMTAMHALAAGNLEHRVKVERLDEMGQLLIAIDAMTNWLAVMLDNDESQDMPPAPDSLSGLPALAELHELLDELNYIEVPGRSATSQPPRPTHQVGSGINVT